MSYNRWTLTAETLASYLDTVTVPYSFIIVDNGSSPNVVEWIQGLSVPYLLLHENRYPGYATNRGWERMPPQTTLLQRIDNDTRFLPDWCDEMVDAFTDPTVGQYGPVAAGDEPWTSMDAWPVGGNSVITRAVYERGVRYSERPWGSPGLAEDAQLTADIRGLGYRRIFGTRPGIVYLDDDDEVYRTATHQIRGLL